MATEAIGGEDSRVKKKWGEENYKVYTRRKNNKAKTPAAVVPTQSSQQTLTTATTTDENNKSSPPQKVPEVVPSDDSSSRNPVELAADDATATAKVNATPGYVKLDGLVKINFKSIEKGEARDAKRMLVSELDQVSTLVKKLEVKIAELSSEYNNSQFSANEIVDRGISLMRVNSDVGSVGIAHSQPFPGSSISVVNNSSYTHAGHGVGVYGNSGEFAEKEKRTRKANQLYKNSEFLLAKDKLTLVESNKKLKPNVGRTNGGKPGGGFGAERFSSQALKACSSLLSKLMKHHYGWVFNSPVDVKALGLYDYYTIIKHPMDLGTVKTRLAKNWYKSPREFAEDVRLTFNNAMLYNPEGQDVHAMAETLAKIFEEKWAAIESDYIFNWKYDMGHDSSLPTHFSRKSIISTPAAVSAPLTPSAPAITPLETRAYERSESMTTPVNPKPRMTHLAPPGRTPAPKKPKAKDPHKRDMTFEEKQKLSVNLQKLPPEKLDSIVQIINKRNPAIFQQEEEIEVDIDNVDAETLWELDRFVTNYKKSLSKNKRKAELALQASKGLHQSVREKVWVMNLSQIA